jgi:hypothetical protein
MPAPVGASTRWHPRAPRAVLPQGRRLEPLQRQHRRHAGGEVLPLLQPDGVDPRRAPLRVFASGGQRVNHLDERYGGRARHPGQRLRRRRVPQRRARHAGPVHVRRELGRQRAHHRGGRRRQARVAAAVARAALRPARGLGPREVWGQPSGSGKGVSVRRVWDTSIKYMGTTLARLTSST